jgi:signal transduction histidine kinase
MWRGIRARITALAAIAVIVVLGATAGALLTIQRRLLTDSLDETLSAHVADLARAVASGPIADPLAPRGDDDSIAQITTTDGRVVAATANYAGHAALRPPPVGAASTLRTDRLFPAEPPYRLLSRRVNDYIVHFASPTDDIDESIAALRRALAVAIPFAVVVLAGLIWWLVGRTLRPVEAIRHQVAGITGTSLYTRVPEPDSNDEIQRLAHTMNAMLDRVEQASASQRRFVADASHELRSPLTRIRSELEVDLAHPDSADAAATHRSVLEEVEHMQRLVDDLLVLARHDNQPSMPALTSVVDLDDIVLDEIRRHADASVEIDAGAVSAAQVSGNPAHLARLVRNLIDNAIRHARMTVTVSLAEHQTTAILTITDDGPGIPTADQERVFERFTRLDFARASADGGSGLGLAIARAIVADHHGTIAFDPHHDRGARVVVQLPIATIGTQLDSVEPHPSKFNS